MEEVVPPLDADAAGNLAQQIADRDGCDVLIYNGDIGRGADLDFISTVYSNQRHEKCLLLLVTPGGDPDAAYKIARYLQERYTHVALLVSGMCKSAGTLVAMGAHELIFTPYGELGPLDVQIFKEDKLSAMHSGLNISEALKSIEKASLKTYVDLIGRIVQNSGGVVSFPTAATAASEVLAALYSPVFAQIDPEDVGSRTRSMRIAADYGKRLDVVGKNLKPGAVDKLAETYSSHSFVIDKMEAKGLFKNVRDADPLILELVGTMGQVSRFPQKTAVIDCLSVPPEGEEGSHDVQPEPKVSPPQPDGADRENTAGAGGAAQPDAGRPRSRVPGRRPAPNLRAIEGARDGTED